MASEVDSCVEFSKLKKCKSRKRKFARSLSSMLNEKLNFETSTKKELKLLQEALDTLDSQNKEDEQVDIVLLPAPNQENGETWHWQWDGWWKQSQSNLIESSC